MAVLKRIGGRMAIAISLTVVVGALTGGAPALAADGATDRDAAGPGCRWSHVWLRTDDLFTWRQACIAGTVINSDEYPGDEPCQYSELYLDVDPDRDNRPDVVWLCAGGGVARAQLGRDVHAVD